MGPILGAIYLKERAPFGACKVGTLLLQIRPFEGHFSYAKQVILGGIGPLRGPYCVRKWGPVGPLLLVVMAPYLGPGAPILGAYYLRKWALFGAHYIGDYQLNY